MDLDVQSLLARNVLIFVRFIAEHSRTFTSITSASFNRSHPSGPSKLIPRLGVPTAFRLRILHFQYRNSTSTSQLVADGFDSNEQ